MKMIYGGTPVKSLKVKHYEMNTNDCDMIASDLQAGKTAVARGQKITGTGKSFEFARYGELYTNDSEYVPSNINTILISSTDVPVLLAFSIGDAKNKNFDTPIEIGSAFVDGVSYPIFISVQGNIISTTCEKTIVLQVFFGKDNYV